MATTFPARPHLASAAQGASDSSVVPAPRPAAPETKVKQLSFSFPFFKKGVRPTDAAVKFTDEHEIYRLLAGHEPSGSYLLSNKGIWHGGIHVTDKGAGTKLDLSQGARCIADGHVIAYRINRTYPVSELPAANGHPARQVPYSTGFALVRHSMEFPKGTILTFYSLYMHLQAYEDYERDTRKPKPFYWATQWKITEYARDTPKSGRSGQTADASQQGLNVRASAPRGRRGDVIAILPQGAQVSLEREGNWGKIKDTHGARLYAREAGAVMPVSSSAIGGWIFLGNEHGGAVAQEVMPDDAFDRVVITMSTSGNAADPNAQGIPIRAGELVGHLGWNDSLNGSPSSTRMVHIEVFCGDGIKPFIDQGRAWVTSHGAHREDWSPLGLSAEPTLLRVDRNTKLYRAAEREGAAAPKTGVVQRWSLAELSRDRNNQHAETVADRSGRKMNWWRVGSANAASQAIDGWVREEGFAGGRVTREFAQKWVDFVHIEEAHDATHTMFATARAWVDYRGRSDIADAKAETKLSPLMKKVYRTLFPEGDGSRAADQLCSAFDGNADGYPWPMLAASRLIVKHESEWANPNKWKQLYAEIGQDAELNAQYKEEQKRIEKLVWWNEVKEKVPEFPGPGVFHIHPIGLVGNFLGGGCSCGCCYIDKFDVVRWAGQTIHFGPQFKGNVALERSPSLDRLLATSQITDSERRILVAMSPNEGNMDAVQAWDSEIFTAGACQKTVNINGAGEFPRQVYEFNEENAAAYQRLFEDCGWSVATGDGPSSTPTMFYKDSELTGGRRITGRELFELMRVGSSETTRGKKVRHKPLASIVNAIADPEFQDKQVRDFVARLRLVIDSIPSGYASRIGDYFQTELGRAAALDQHVNRPNNVRVDIGIALDAFFRAHPNVDRDPARWGEGRALYEAEVISHYSQGRRMNDAAARFSALSRTLS